MDKEKDEFIEFCNECDWKEETKGLPYKFCPKCGHVNIGFTRKDKYLSLSNRRKTGLFFM